MTFQLKSSHKAVKDYYSETERLSETGAVSEGTVSPAFADLLRHCAAQVNWTLNEKISIRRGKKIIIPDGIFYNEFNLYQGAWEAKDSQDKLDTEVRSKFADGYPGDNIIFQSPDQIIIWQNSREVFNKKITSAENLIEALNIFFSYQHPAYRQWEEAAEKFREQMPKIGAGILDLIDKEYRINTDFVQAMQRFTNLVRDSINPNISPAAVKEMLIQHLLTERVFRKVFNHPDFTSKNTIAVEIEKVIAALTSRHFNRNGFLQPLEHFYKAIEITAATIEDYSEKQFFLNTVYEKFFQGFAVKAADTHGIVYTPQPVVDFMVKSVEDILHKEFGRSLSDKHVHILDPFVGTGNFIIRIMNEIRKTALPDKYREELHCNEVMLLPYYIAATNIEHKYYELIGEYKPFDGICLVDTFELAEDKQMSVFTAKNTERVNIQKETQIFVIIGNPPYNAGQVNENDNNKNRKYPVMDRLVRESYARDSEATNKNALSDPYVKAIKWASEKIRENGEGIVAFVTNNSFIDSIAFDGMRKHLTDDFSKIYHIDLKGNARTSGERRRQESGNVFDDAIRVSVGITFFIKKKGDTSPAEIYMYSLDDYLKSDDKKEFLEKAGYYANIPLKRIIPDEKHNWLTEGLKDEFENFMPMGTKDAKRHLSQNSVFIIYSNGNDSGRDSWVYNFNYDELLINTKNFAENYNAEVDRWKRAGQPDNIDDFVIYDNSRIKWTRNAKRDLRIGRYAEFSPEKVRNALYRPFSKQYLYSGRIFNKEVGKFPLIIPDKEKELENTVICLSGIGSNKPFHALMTNLIPCLDMIEKGQCFPFYIYAEDGSNRQENITYWALKKFRKRYKDNSISKWDIFHYIYGLLHSPQYREKYAANLKRELPRIPFVPDFRAFTEAGKKLAELHVNYENQPEYSLQQIENPDEKPDWRVEKMRLSKDKSLIIYNNFLTLSGIPEEAYEYRLGNRSALDWIIDQYQVKTDKRSGIVNDPNRADDPQYIVKLIGKVIAVSVETVKVVKELSGIEKENY